MLKIAICDDDPQSRDNIKSLVNLYQVQNVAAAQVDIYESALQLLDALRTESYQLILLDIIMPGMTGMQAAKEIRRYDNETKIVFLTSSPEYAVESYTVDAFSYLLKPITQEGFFPILDKAMARINKAQESITLVLTSGVVRIPYSKIEFIEVNSKHLLFYLEDGTKYELTGTLSEYEPKFLNRPEFAKVHRSYIVNLSHVKSLESRELRTYAGKSAPISRLLYSQIKQQYMDFLFSGGGDF